MLNPNDVEQAVWDNSDPCNILFNHFSGYTKNPFLSPIIRMVLKRFWDSIEYILTDVSRVYDAIVEGNPEVKDILDTPQGRDWLNNAVQGSYTSLYNYVWLGVEYV